MRLALVDNLVFPVGRRHTDFDVHPNIGLASLAAVIRSEGHDVRIVDPKREVRQGRLHVDADLYREAAEALLLDAPDAVGFTTLGCSFIFTLRVAEHLKRMQPDLPILLGGPHATVLDRTIMEAFDVFDVVVRHEAEETVNRVLAALERRDFAGLPGVTYRTGRTALGIRSNPGAPKIENLDTLPFPAYDLYPIEELDLPYLRVEAGRGCPWACTFCSTATFFQRSYRLKSPERLVADLDALHDRYGHTAFKLEHDLFTVNKRKVAAFCYAVMDRNYAWMASARIDCVDEPLLELMAASGCRQLYFGIETASVALQQSLKKRLNLTLLEPVLRKATEVGIEAVTSFVTGFPEETEENRDDTLSLIGSLVSRFDPPPRPQLHLLLPEPGTGEFAEHGHELAFDGHVAEFNAEPHREDHGLIVRHPAIFATYHHYPGLIPRQRQIAVVEITRQLLSLGPIVLRQVLLASAFDLAELVGEVVGSSEGSGAGDALVTAVTQKFGREHFVTSLVRLRVGLEAPKWSSPAPSGGRGDGALVLSDRAVLFDELHDCGSLLDHFAKEPSRPPPDDRGTTRHDYLAVLNGEDARLFEVDPLTYLVASLFVAPSTVEAVTKSLCELMGRPVPVVTIVERLARAGALVVASAEAQGAALAAV